MLVSALSIALTLAFPAVASGQTPFQADVNSTQIRPGLCANGAYACGTANLAGYGAASWNWYPTSVTAVQTSCGSSYTATVDFILVSEPGSTLVLDEAGNLCAPGNDGAGYFNEPPQAYGHPYAIVGSWTVDPSSTGQFLGLAGSGTDLIEIAGAHSGGSYSGTFG